MISAFLTFAVTILLAVLAAGMMAVLVVVSEDWLRPPRI